MECETDTQENDSVGEEAQPTVTLAEYLKDIILNIGFLVSNCTRCSTKDETDHFYQAAKQHALWIGKDIEALILGLRTPDV